MSRVLAFALAAALSAATALPARADDAADFMQRFSGSWIGTGQLLVGPENGVEFICELNGDPSATQMSFGMTGRCRMGVFSAPVHARLRYNAETSRFYGQFMDGAEGSGLDIVGARAGQGFSLNLTRGPTQGRLQADTVSGDQMRVTIYVSDPNSDRELPVVAMGFTRKQAITGSLQSN